jgi:hypothetical protein
MDEIEMDRNFLSVSFQNGDGHHGEEREARTQKRNEPGSREHEVDCSIFLDSTHHQAENGTSAFGYDLQEQFEQALPKFHRHGERGALGAIRARWRIACLSGPETNRDA